MRKNRLFEVRKTLNEIEDIARDRMRIAGSKQIDMILSAEDVLRAFQESILVGSRHILSTNYR